MTDERIALLDAMIIIGQARHRLLEEYTFWKFIKDQFTGKHSTAWRVTEHVLKYQMNRFSELQHEKRAMLDEILDEIRTAQGVSR